MVGVAQLVELQVVVLAAAGSSPVSHPNPTTTGRRMRRPSITTTCGCGGTGRRARLRIWWAPARGGSSPLTRTTGSSVPPHGQGGERRRPQRRRHSPATNGESTVKTKVDAVAENEVELSVEVPADVVNRTYERTIASLRHELAIPGFRKGHVPRNMVVAHYGEQLIREQTLEDAIPMWGDAALRDAGLHDDAVATSDLVAGPLDENADYCFSIRGADDADADPWGVQGSGGPQAPGRDHRRSGRCPARYAAGASCDAAAGRGPPGAEGDFVAHRPRGLARRRTHRGRSGQGSHVRGRQRASSSPASRRSSSASRAARRRAFELTFPDDYQAEELAGQPATFKVTVKEIKEKVVPELDDEFAAEASEFETLAELRADMRARLEEAAAAASSGSSATAVVDKAVENASVGRARAMIEREAHRSTTSSSDRRRARHGRWTTYLGVLEKTRKRSRTAAAAGRSRRPAAPRDRCHRRRRGIEVERRRGARAQSSGTPRPLERDYLQAPRRSPQVRKARAGARRIGNGQDGRLPRRAGRRR